MDIATLLGILSSFGLVFAAIFMGGGLKLFVSVPAMLIVVGGTLGATMINYPLRDVLGAFNVVKNVFIRKVIDFEDIINIFVVLSNKARKEGILSIEGDIIVLDDKFTIKGLMLAIDGTEPDSIMRIMSTEVDYLRDRHQFGAEIFSTMGAFAPALGMIGTLIGLVQMLQSMGNPDSIGPAMAVALLTTFYGSVMANLIFMPIAGKLRTRSRKEATGKEMIIEGVIALSTGENPRLLEQRMRSFLPSSRHESTA